MRSNLLVLWALSGWVAACLGCAEDGTSSSRGSGGDEDDEGAGSVSSSGSSTSGAGGAGGGGTSAGGGGSGAGGSGAGGSGTGGGGAGGSGTGGGGPVGPDCSGLVPQSKPGLGAWYRFEEEMGLVCDWSGNDNHGVVEGAGITRGVGSPVGKAIRFNGTDGRVHVPASPSLDFLTAATIELWVRLDSQGSVGSTVSRGTGNNDKNVLMNSSCGNMQTVFSTLGGTTSVTSDCNMIPGSTWKHIAIVNNGVTLTMYLNGAVVATANGGFLGAIPSDLYIGRREQGIFSFDGAVDEIKWWSVARSQQEVCGDAGGAWQNGMCILP